MIEIKIGNEQEKQRLDRFLKKYLPKAPLSHIYKIIRKDLKVNGKRVPPEYVLNYGDALNLYMPEELIREYSEVKKPAYAKAKKQFTVIYEDDNILLVNKPKGLLTHGDKTEKKNTLVNQVVNYLVDKGDYRFSRVNTFVPAPVNRLDRNTSGIVIFGKNNLSLQCLNRMIKDKESIGKYYLAIAKGILEKPVVLRSTMQKDEENNMIHLSDESAPGLKVMETIIRPLAVNNGFTLVEAQLVTGRTHQIRAHLASQRLFIIGDIKYGSPQGNAYAKQKYGLTTQFLHAYKLKFENCPELFEYLNGKEFEAPLPEDLKKIRNSMFGDGKNGNNR